MKNGVLKWVDAFQRRQIAKEFGISSNRQIYNILKKVEQGEPTNFSLVERLVQQAEQNKGLKERIKNL